MVPVSPVARFLANRVPKMMLLPPLCWHFGAVQDHTVAHVLLTSWDSQAESSFQHISAASMYAKKVTRSISALFLVTKMVNFTTVTLRCHWYHLRKWLQRFNNGMRSELWGFTVCVCVCVLLSVCGVTKTDWPNRWQCVFTDWSLSHMSHWTSASEQKGSVGTLLI